MTPDWLVVENACYITVTRSRVRYPHLLVLLVLCDDAADAVDKHHLVVRNEAHELMLAVAIEQHQDLHLLLGHLRRRNVHATALRCKMHTLTNLSRLRKSTQKLTLT